MSQVIESPVNLSTRENSQEPLDRDEDSAEEYLQVVGQHAAAGCDASRSTKLRRLRRMSDPVASPVFQKSLTLPSAAPGAAALAQSSTAIALPDSTVSEITEVNRLLQSISASMPWLIIMTVSQLSYASKAEQQQSVVETIEKCHAAARKNFNEAMKEYREIIDSKIKETAIKKQGLVSCTVFRGIMSFIEIAVGVVTLPFSIVGGIGLIIHGAMTMVRVVSDVIKLSTGKSDENPGKFDTFMGLASGLFVIFMQGVGRFIAAINEAGTQAINYGFKAKLATVIHEADLANAKYERIRQSGQELRKTLENLTTQGSAEIRELARMAEMRCKAIDALLRSRTAYVAEPQ